MLGVLAEATKIGTRARIYRVVGALIGRRFVVMMILGRTTVILKDRSTWDHFNTEVGTRPRCFKDMGIRMVVMMIVMAMVSVVVMLIATIVIMVVIMMAVSFGRLSFEKISNFLDDIRIRGDMEIDQWLDHLLAILRFGHLHRNQGIHIHQTKIQTIWSH